MSFPIRLNVAGEQLGAVAAVIGALILIGLSIPYVSRTILEERRAASREDRPLLARVPVELFVLPLGVFAFLQLRTGTGPEAGSGEIDPLILVAPTLLLFGGSFLALRLLLLVFRALDSRIGRSRHLSRYLAGRRVGRSPGTGFAAALLLLLSMGLLVVSTSYRAIVLRNHEDAAHAQVGADWRINVTPPENVLTAIDQMPPLTTPVVRTDPRLETGSFNLPPVALGIDPERHAAAAWWREDFSETPLPEIMQQLETPAFGMDLPAPTSTLTLEIDSGPDVRNLQITATGVDEDGVVHTSALQPVELGVATYELDLDDAVRLFSITISRTSLDSADEVTFVISSVEADGEAISLAGWEPLTWRGSAGTVEAEGDGVRYEMESGASDVIGGIVPSSDPLPALVSPGIASPGGPLFQVTLGGQELQLDPVVGALQFPSMIPNAPFIVLSGPALLERAAAVPEAGLVLNEVWAEGDRSPIPLLEAQGFFPGATARTAPIEGFLAQLPQSLALGMNFVSAAGGAGLVIVGVAAALYFAQRRRDYEFAALRAMGAPSSQIVRTLALEQVLLLGFAVRRGPRPRVRPADPDDAVRRPEPLGLLSPTRVPDGLDVARDRPRGDPRRDRARARAVRARDAPRLGHRRAARGGGVIENEVSTDRYRPEGEDALVRLRHTYKVYRVGDMGVVALAGVDLDVHPGEFLAVVGPSGAGKSTILNLVGGLDRASAGVVEVEGRDLGLLEDEALTEYRAERIGFVWQGTARNLVPYLSVRENIRLPATVRRTQVARKHDVDGLLELVGLNDRAKHTPGMLSGGEQQRVAIAAALSNTPSILLADEPTAELDSESAGRVLDAFRAVNHEFHVTIIMVTHDLVAARRADRRIRVRDGRVLHEGVPVDPVSDDGRVRLPDEAVAALGGVDLEAEVTGGRGPPATTERDRSCLSPRSSKGSTSSAGTPARRGSSRSAAPRSRSDRRTSWR